MNDDDYDDESRLMRLAGFVEYDEAAIPLGNERKAIAAFLRQMATQEDIGFCHPGTWVIALTRAADRVEKGEYRQD